MTKEELLEKAKRNYPVGTIIKLSNGNTTDVKENIYFDKSDLNVIWNDGYGRIYDNGKWAEIVSKPEEKKENSKSLVGRYLKALVDYPSAGRVKKGEYGKIIDNYTADFPSQKGYACKKAISMVSDSNTIYDGRYELMPEGFNPDEVAFGILIDLEEIKKQIIEKYPIGTCFRDLVNNEILIVKNHNFDTFGKTNQLYVPVEYNKLGNKTARIWKEGIFAEIISKAKEVIPEYVECLIDGTDRTKGKIYKVIKIYSNSFTVEDDLSSNTWSGNILQNKNFKPSTKELYEAQLIKLEHPLIPKQSINPMIKIQEEAKKRFPIGCEFINTIGNKYILEKDDFTYKIVDDCIYANNGKGCLYQNGEWATLVEKKKEEYIPQVDDWVITDMYNVTIPSTTKAVKVIEEDLTAVNQPNFKVITSDGNMVWCYPHNGKKFVRKAEIHEIAQSIETVFEDDNFTIKRGEINPSEVVEHFEKEITSKIPNPAYMVDNTCAVSPLENQIKFEEKPQWLVSLNDVWPQTVKKQSNKIKAKLIPVKKLIKN